MKILQTGSAKHTSPRNCVDRTLVLHTFHPAGGSAWSPEDSLPTAEIEVDGTTPDENRDCRYIVQLTVPEIVALLFSLGSHITAEDIKHAIALHTKHCNLPENENRVTASIAALLKGFGENI